jgi:hypothetical protein
MTTHNRRRWGAVLLTGGICLAVAYLIYPSSARSSMIRPAASLGLVGISLGLVGLVAYQRGQSSRAAVNGWIGTSILCLGLGLLEIPHLVLGAFSPSSLYDLDAYHAGVWGTLAFFGLTLVPVGLIVLAVATRRSNAYPRWAVWTLVASVVVAAADSFVEPLGNALRSPAPNYLLMALSGLAMIRATMWDRTAGSDAAAQVSQSHPATSATP